MFEETRTVIVKTRGVWVSVNLVVLLLTGWPSHVLAQATTGALSGVVHDARTRQPLPGVLVEVGMPRQAATTDAEGRFRFDAVPIGKVELLVSLVGYGFAKRDVEVRPGETDVTIPLSEGTAAYAESVVVQGDVFGARETGVAAQQSLGSAELRQLAGMTLDDPLRAVQALAGVNSSDDFYSDLSVRGNGFRHLNYTLDGVPAGFLMHTIEFVEDGGSVSMINTDVLDHVTLLRGAYPQRFGQRLGAELAFGAVEGSRQRNRYNATASGTSASLTVDGPLGHSGRGSWLVSGRRSYLDILLKQVLNNSSNIAFGFMDVFSKVVYDVSDRHQVQASMLMGRSRLNSEPDTDNLQALGTATHAGWMGTAAWRHTVSPSLALTHRLFFLGDSYDNHNGRNVDVAQGHARDHGYRVDAVYSPGAGRLVEAGFSAQRLSERQLNAFQVPGWRILGGEDFNAQANNVGGYGEMRWTLGRITLTPGTRVDRSGLIDHWVASPWLQADWQVPADLTLVFGAGLHHQFPEFAQVVGTRGRTGLSPERAVHVDVGLEGQLGTAARWQVSAYNREERDVLDLPDSYFWRVGDLVQPPSATSLWESRLDGWSRGIELMVQRKSPDKLSGWFAYSFGHTRYTDRVTGERFDGDFDQRHTVSLFGRYRISDRMSANARFRYGSNRPLLGYFDRRTAGQFFVGTERNTTRVPAYARLDVRADRTYRWGRRRLTLFGEVTNVLGRENQRQVPPFVSTRTGQVFRPFDTMFPRIPSVGVTVEF